MASSPYLVFGNVTLLGIRIASFYSPSVLSVFTTVIAQLFTSSAVGNVTADDVSIVAVTPLSPTLACVLQV